MGAVMGAVALAGFVAAEDAAVAAEPALDFTLRDINGESVTLSSLKGKVVVLSFWATWCGPCKEEMPHLQKMYTELKGQGLVVLSISIDDARTASQVKPWIMSKGYNFPVLLDKSSEAVVKYNPGKTVPYTVVIGRDHQIFERQAGYAPGDELKLKEKILGLLAKGG
jgi:peroxiredoxin